MIKIDSKIPEGNTAETWTGRGKQPRWLVAQLEKGAKLEDFLI
jgi:DNA-binding protein H-NS